MGLCRGHRNHLSRSWTCDQTYSAENEIDVTLLSHASDVCHSRSLPDPNFHTGGDWAAAADPYVPGFKSSRDTPHHTKKSNMPRAFQLISKTRCPFNPRNETACPTTFSRQRQLEVTPVLVHWRSISYSIHKDLGWRLRSYQPRHIPRRPMPTS